MTDTWTLIKPFATTTKHGTLNAYTNYGCRCQPCKDENTKSTLRGRKSRTERLKANPGLMPHGRYMTYQNWGCRCRACTTAHSNASRDGYKDADKP